MSPILNLHQYLRTMRPRNIGLKLEAIKDLFFARGPLPRSRDRLRRAGLTGTASLLARGTGIAVSLVTIPLVMGYLGQERYGIWVILGSLTSWLLISDLGFSGNALVNALSEATGRDDQALGQQLVATSFWCLLGIAGALAFIFTLLFPVIPWASFFNSSPDVPAWELHWAVILSLACFLLMFPLRIVGSVYSGYQEGYIGYIWAIIGSILTLFVLFGITRVPGGLLELILALSGARVIVASANAIYLFYQHRPWLFPRLRDVTKKSFRRLRSLGLKYLVSQLAGIALLHSQPIIITQLLGPGDVSIFHIAHRILTLPLMVVQMFTFPLLAAYGEAYSRRDWPWMSRTLRRSLLASLLIGICSSLLLALIARPVIEIWVGSNLVPDFTLVASLCTYVILCSAATPISVFLHGLEYVGGQAAITVTSSVLTVGLGIWLTGELGLSGMGIAMATGIAVNLILQVVHYQMVKRKTDMLDQEV